jgi:glutaredoxin
MTTTEPGNGAAVTGVGGPADPSIPAPEPEPEGRRQRRPGSQRGPRPARVTLVTRAGCHLCDEATMVLRRLSAENGFAWDELDVDADPEWADAYGDKVPVILVDGEEHGYWRVEEARLLRALRETAPGSGAGTGRPARSR